MKILLSVPRKSVILLGIRSRLTVNQTKNTISSRRNLMLNLRIVLGNIRIVMNMLWIYSINVWHNKRREINLCTQPILRKIRSAKTHSKWGKAPTWNLSTTFQKENKNDGLKLWLI